MQTASRKFDGKVALITGASTGIGRATAVALAREGATVAIGDINEAGSNETVRLIEEAGPFGQAAARVACCGGEIWTRLQGP